MMRELLHCAQFDEWAGSGDCTLPIVQLACRLPAGVARFPGGELPALQDALGQAVGHYQRALAQQHHQHQQHLQHLQHQWPQQPEPALMAAQALLESLAGVGAQRVSLQWGARTGLHLRSALRQAQAPLHWRRYRFQSAHRLPHVPVGHQCGRMHGHGFEAVISARSGWAELDEAWAPLHALLNYRCLNTIDGLDNPTSERLAQWLWQHLANSVAGLESVSVFETASCGAHAQDAGTRLRIWKDFSLDSATQLNQAPASHPRAQLHGHTYGLRLHLQAELDQRLGWAVDFADIKQAFKSIFDRIDHQRIDDLPAHAQHPVHNGDCASLARWVAAHTQAVLPNLYRVDLSETPGCGVSLGTALPEVSDGPLLPASAP